MIYTIIPRLPTFVHRMTLKFFWFYYKCISSLRFYFAIILKEELLKTVCHHLGCTSSQLHDTFVICIKQCYCKASYFHMCTPQNFRCWQNNIFHNSLINCPEERDRPGRRICYVQHSSYHHVTLRSLAPSQLVQPTTTFTDTDTDTEFYYTLAAISRIAE